MCISKERLTDVVAYIHMLVFHGACSGIKFESIFNLISCLRGLMHFLTKLQLLQQIYHLIRVIYTDTDVE